MPSPSSLFQTVVHKNAPRETREDAIERLEELGATKQLRVIVVTGGLDGRYRRQALNALGRCKATTELEQLANNRSVDTPLRKQATLSS